jgi:hypothetical protein
MSVINPPSVVAGENNIGGEEREIELSAMDRQLFAFRLLRFMRHTRIEDDSLVMGAPNHRLLCGVPGCSGISEKLNAESFSRAIRRPP